MSNEDYIAIILKILKKLDNKQLKRIFEYAHYIFIGNAGS